LARDAFFQTVDSLNSLRLFFGGFRQYFPNDTILRLGQALSDPSRFFDPQNISSHILVPPPQTRLDPFQDRRRVPAKPPLFFFPASSAGGGAARDDGPREFFGFPFPESGGDNLPAISLGTLEDLPSKKYFPEFLPPRGTTDSAGIIP